MWENISRYNKGNILLTSMYGASNAFLKEILNKQGGFIFTTYGVNMIDQTQSATLALLANISLFSSLNEQELDKIQRHAVTRSYPKNSVIMNEGAPARSLYVIIKGRVKIFLTDDEGKEVIINCQGVGEYFGELALIDGAERSTQVMTMEPSTFVEISKSSFHDLLAAYPNIALSLIQDLTKRVRVLTDNVRSLALMDVYGRVAKILLSMATDHDGKLFIEDKLTQQDIASRIGASREMVSRILKDLTAGGYITMEGKHIVINERLPKHY
jgi:CRP/FNR family cyclic AMP-dependent transcriptional regulator